MHTNALPSKTRGRASRIVTAGATILATAIELPLAVALVAGVVFIAPKAAEARPVVRRAPATYYRGPASVHGTARRTSRRTSRRVARRHYYTMPRGYRPYTYGRYRYYTVGGVYYYPYYISGQPVYIEIDVDANGNPLPPPPTSQVQTEVNF